MSCTEELIENATDNITEKEWTDEEIVDQIQIEQDQGRWGKYQGCGRGALQVPHFSS
jgi:hypothetical protein